MGKAEIFAQIAKPTNARKELPTKQSVATGGASEQIMGDISAWGFEGSGNLTETYSSWDNPTSFTSGGGSMFTFLNEQASGGSAGPGMPSGDAVSSENTIKSKTGSNSDVESRLAAIQEQRKSEFSTVTRK